jgi:uncharacterized protein
MILRLCLVSCLLLHISLARSAEPAAPGGPRVDHHEHLLSPALAALMAPAEGFALAPVTLPPDIADLLARRATAWNDTAALARLYAERVVLAQYADQTLLMQDSLFNGREAVSEYLATRVFARAYSITPVSVEMHGSTAHVAAVLGRPVPRGDAGDYLHIGSVLFSLARDGEGPWLITAEAMKFPGPPTYTPIDADALVALLDEAGIERAVVLSGAYLFESPSAPKASDAAARLRAENTWTAAQVARHPARLIGFCGLNPLTDTALKELDRCARGLHLKGLKLHLGNSGVNLQDAAHVARVQKVFARANRLGLPIVVHVATLDFAAGRRNAEIFLEAILPVAPDVVVQIAHLAGSGPGWDDEAIDVFAAAVEKHDARTRRLYFDVATVADLQKTDRLRLLARRIRQIGPQRILFGSDGAFGGRKTPAQEWATFRGMVPLTDAEFAVIRDNVAPYLR